MLMTNHLCGFGARPYHKTDKAIDAIHRLGLASGLKLCLDAGDANSYTSGQKWLDVSGNGYDFFLGASGSASSDDPTFNGSAGGLSSAEYFSFDGGDFLDYDTSNETWMENLHKDNAKFTVATWWYVIDVPGGSANCLFSTHNGNSLLGVDVRLSASEVFSVVSGNGSVGTTISADHAGNIGAWNFFAVSIDEAAGATGAVFCTNGAISTKDATYTSPSASASTQAFTIGRRNGTSFILLDGSRIGMLLVWEGTVLSAGALGALYQATKPRYGF
jgi:hypothetical protein